MADITVSFAGELRHPRLPERVPWARCLGGFAAQGVEIYVPASRLEEAQALLDAPAEIPEQD